jgi:hypothetical protein
VDEEAERMCTGECCAQLLRETLKPSFNFNSLAMCSSPHLGCANLFGVQSP